MPTEARSAEAVVDSLLSKAHQVEDCLICHLSPTVTKPGWVKAYVQVGGRSGKKWIVSRLVYSVKIGLIPEGACVLHRCDNPLCINPEHLFIGGNQDNTNDMIAKGRAKLVQPRTDHKYRADILVLHNKGLDRFQIAEELHVSPNTVWNYISPKGAYYEC